MPGPLCRILTLANINDKNQFEEINLQSLSLPPADLHSAAIYYLQTPSHNKFTTLPILTSSVDSGGGQGGKIRLGGGKSLL
jgi:hypothetical protein